MTHRALSTWRDILAISRNANTVPGQQAGAERHSMGDNLHALCEKASRYDAGEHQDTSDLHGEVKFLTEVRMFVGELGPLSVKLDSESFNLGLLVGRVSFGCGFLSQHARDRVGRNHQIGDDDLLTGKEGSVVFHVKAPQKFESKGARP